jgi:cytoskeletal protein CcmA (bactofilin family)
MGIFGDSGKKAPDVPAANRATPAGAPGLSIVGSGMTVQGDVDTGGVVKIEGSVNGHVHATQQVLVAKGGRIDGDIETGEAMIAGVVHGAVRAQQRVEIQAGAIVEGDVTTRRILVAEGAVLNGAVRMVGEHEEAAPAEQGAVSPNADTSR